MTGKMGHPKWQTDYSTRRPVRSPRLFYGWWIVVASCAMSLTSSLIFYGFTTFFDPIQDAFGWSSTAISIGFIFQRAEWGGAALLVGFALGLFRLAVDTPVTLGLPGFEQGYPEGSILWIVNNTFFQYYSLFIIVVCVTVMVAVSCATRKPRPEKIDGLTFATVSREDRARSRASWTFWDVAASGIVLLGILAAYLYFSG